MSSRGFLVPVLKNLNLDRLDSRELGLRMLSAFQHGAFVWFYLDFDHFTNSENAF